MGADLFESYVGSIIGTMVLGAAMVAGSSNFADFLGGLSPVFFTTNFGCCWDYYIDPWYFPRQSKRRWRPTESPEHR